MYYKNQGYYSHLENIKTIIGKHPFNEISKHKMLDGKILNKSFLTNNSRSIEY